MGLRLPCLRFLETNRRAVRTAISSAIISCEAYSSSRRLVRNQASLTIFYRLSFSPVSPLWKFPLTIKSSRKWAISLCSFGRAAALKRRRNSLSSQCVRRPHSSLPRCTALPYGVQGRPKMSRSTADSSHHAHVKAWCPHFPSFVPTTPMTENGMKCTASFCSCPFDRVCGLLGFSQYLSIISHTRTASAQATKTWLPSSETERMAIRM